MVVLSVVAVYWTVTSPLSASEYVAVAVSVPGYPISPAELMCWKLTLLSPMDDTVQLALSNPTFPPCRVWGALLADTWKVSPSKLKVESLIRLATRPTELPMYREPSLPWSEGQERAMSAKLQATFYCNLASYL